MNHLFAGYHAPTDTAAAVQAVSDHPDATVVAGGTVALAIDRRPPGRQDTVIDLTNAGLDTVRIDGDELTLGATVTYRQVLASPELAERAPLLPRVASGITGGPQIRNRGTLGGSACNADPASDVPAALVALGAVILVEGRGGARRVEATAFFRGPYSTALEAGEVLTAIHIPLEPEVGRFGYHKVKMSESSWPLATAVVVERAGRARLTLGAVMPRPVSVTLPAPLEEVARPTLDELVASVLEGETVWSDELGSATYRARIAPAAAWRALTEARNGADAGGRTRSEP